MGSMHRLAAAVTCCLALLGSQVSAQNLVNGQCVQNYDANTDYFPDKINARADDAQYFEIEYHNNYKIVTDHLGNKQYYLVQCGTPMPSLPANAEVYSIPVTSVGAVETTVVPYLEMLGVATTIDVISDASFVSSNCFEKYVETSNNVTQLSTTNATLADEQAAGVEVLFGTSFYTSSFSNSTVTSSEAFEPDVLGRMAWVSYYSAFYNLEARANQIISDITDNYNRLVEASSHYSDKEKPLVAWAMYDAPDQYNGNIASWNVSTASYKVQLTKDAGARILDTGKGQYFDRAEFLQAITDVDVLIDETYVAKTLDDVVTAYGISSNMTFKFLEKKAVYRQDGILTSSGGVDWFVGGIVMPDAVLEDVINCVNPSAPLPDYKRLWLRNIAKNETTYYNSASKCTRDYNTPRPNNAVTYNGGAFTMSSAALPNVATGWTLGAALMPLLAFFLY